MMERIAEGSPRFKSRMAGFLLCLPRIVSVAINAHPCGTLIADLIDELATLLAVALGGLAVYGAETSTSKC
jgi:hypothetical protein